MMVSKILKGTRSDWSAAWRVCRPLNKGILPTGCGQDDLAPKKKT
ncbi:MAG: hypothetical protein PHH59_06065 [Methylovulum sp.]|nr:hypothetical protein [Methylovulum sp.]MDD2723571.1 hypothetical protein [Methylovulum sp.]MDD5124163.1 hypothetical protein [Methylovulum sp.]